MKQRRKTMNIRTMAVFLAIVGALVCGTVAYAETPLTDNEKQGNAPKGMYSAFSASYPPIKWMWFMTMR